MTELEKEVQRYKEAARSVLGVMPNIHVTWSRSCSRATQDQYVRLKKERDYHRMQHRRVLQEKAGLAVEAGRLRKHFASHEPLLQTLRKKYQVRYHSHCAAYCVDVMGVTCSP